LSFIEKRIHEIFPAWGEMHIFKQAFHDIFPDRLPGPEQPRLQLRLDLF